MDHPQVPLIGIVGGVASGKSFVAGQLERKGAAIISADRLAHEVLKYDEVKTALRQRWGSKVFGPTGDVERPAVAKIVFGATKEAAGELKFLEQLTHPRIGELVQKRLLELAAQATTQAIVLDVPLMFESGWNNFCDHVIYVDAPRELRWQRAAERGWTQENFDRREELQTALAAKRERANVVIDSSGSPEATQAQVEQFWQTLQPHQQAP